MPSKLISFDLQGTLSSRDFSDEFWLELLPALYASKLQLSLEEAKSRLQDEFKARGKYHPLFYNHRLRLNSLLPKWEFASLIDRLRNRPSIDHRMMDIVRNLPADTPCIVLSATTRDFLDLELGAESGHFSRTISAIDDYATAGKTPALYHLIADEMGVKPENCLHIGDCPEMDIMNARSAGWRTFHFDTPSHTRVSMLRRVIAQFMKRVTPYDEAEAF